jgi:hypothetical protein
MARFTESQWEAVRVTLPRGVDETRFRCALERIAIGTSSPKRQERICFDRAQLCAALIRELPGMEHIKDKDALFEQLKRQKREDTNRGRIYGRIADQKQPNRFLQQCEILQLCEGAGGAVRVTTPRRRRDDPRARPPTGAVIAYFHAAARMICGKAPGAYQIKDICSRYRRALKPGDSFIASFTKLRVDATSVQRASTHIASSTGVRAERT